MGRDGAVLGYDWLARSHLSMLRFFATCTHFASVKITNRARNLVKQSSVTLWLDGLHPSTSVFYIPFVPSIVGSLERECQ